MSPDQSVWQKYGTLGVAEIVVTPGERLSGDRLVQAVKDLRVAHASRRVAVVSAGVSLSASDDYDGLGPLAAAIIRLRIDQWVGVGVQAKALSTQVGLEGSWDGESLWWEAATDAYDYLRAWPKGSDLIAIIGSDHPTIRELLDLVEANHR